MMEIIQRPGGGVVREVVLHCAAIKTAQFAGMSAFEVFSTVNRWHVERGWNSIGYHGLVMPDGTFYKGRPYDMQGAHVRGHNAGTLGILLIESREIDRIGLFEDYFTASQRIALRAVLAALPGIWAVKGHNDFDSGKLCPGFRVDQADWL